MPQSAVDWTGNEWEEHCLNLLRIRYSQPGQLECIPAADQGDLGIEAFAFDGSAYQCYAPDGPLPISARYERQRDKLTEDVAKLEKNQVDLLAVLGGVIIKTYVFMTPIHDSRKLNGHAKKKALEMRDKQLPHLAPEFDVVIQTEAHYVLERTQLLDAGLLKMHLAPVDVNPLQLKAYLESNPDLIQTLNDKLSVLPDLNKAARENLRAHLLTQKLTADNKMDEIRGHHPAAWERIIELRAGRESSLEIECAITTASPEILLRETADVHRVALQENIVFLSEIDAGHLAWGTTTDWLAQCPLRFKAISA